MTPLLAGHRYLIRDIGCEDLLDVVVQEISPSGKHIRIKTTLGLVVTGDSDFELRWMETAEVELVEELPPPPDPVGPPKQDGERMNPQDPSVVSDQ